MLITNYPIVSTKNIHDGRYSYSTILNAAADDTNNDGTYYYLCKTKSFDPRNGEYELSECENTYFRTLNGTWDKEHKYMCGTENNKSITKCNEVIEILNIYNYSYDYSLILGTDSAGNYNSIGEGTEAYQILSSMKNENSKSSLKEIYDTQGISYYYRGNVANNYVKLKSDNADLSPLFQIIRMLLNRIK